MPTAIDNLIDEIMASDDDLDDEDDGESVASDEAAALSKPSSVPAAGDVHELIAELMNINDDNDESVASDGEYCDCHEEDSDDLGDESDHEPSSSPPTRFRRLSRVRKKDVQAEEESSSSSRIILRTNELVRKKISPPFMTASHSREELRLSCYQEEEVLALGKYDCGCTLHANGCYGMILALFVQVHGPSAYEKLINQRTQRFEVVDSLTSSNGLRAFVQRSLVSSSSSGPVPSHSSTRFPRLECAGTLRRLSVLHFSTTPISIQHRE